MKAVLNTTGLIISTKALQERFGRAYNAFLNKLQCRYQPKVGPVKIAKLYSSFVVNEGTENAKCYVNYTRLPRTLLKLLSDKKILTDIEIQFPPIVNVKNNPVMVLDLFENQKIVINRLMEIFTQERIKNGTACAILNLRPGLGKTFVAAGIISSLKINNASLRTLYIVPKQPLAVQAVKDLKACFYSETTKTVIGLYGKIKKKDPTSSSQTHDITVIVINSALLRDADFFAGYSLVIFDEVHTYCSDVRKEIFKKASTWVCLGMSGTTEDRKDGFDTISHKELAFDDIIRAEEIPGFNYDGINFPCDVKVIRYDGPPEYTKVLTHDSTGKVFTPYMNKQFLADPYRMKLVIKELKELYEWKEVINPEEILQHCIYVFCEELEPLKRVYEELKKAVFNAQTEIFAPELTDVGQFVGGIKDAKIRDMTENARVFLTTYGYSGTGISIDKMTAILFLTPRRANMKQILPRILRRGGDQRIKRQVRDIVDNKTLMKYQYYDRKLVYDYYNMNISVSKISYEVI
jgi:hypothetical protein